MADVHAIAWECNAKDDRTNIDSCWLVNSDHLYFNLGTQSYAEGRKYWASLSLASRNLARLIWVHIPEREGELGKDDLLAKL
ncbi:MAG: hypothetical protein M1818_006638 [Claussenomyces sp. TS43310]|nr:MAG: hypothetical protein M1818_006638 [Claussenomyces sp. TS43310]